MYSFEYCSKTLSIKRKTRVVFETSSFDEVIDLEVADPTLMIGPYDYQKPEHISDNKTVLLERFTHHGFTIAGKYHEQWAILPINVSIAVPRFAIIVRIPNVWNS